MDFTNKTIQVLRDGGVSNISYEEISQLQQQDLVEGLADSTDSVEFSIEDLLPLAGRYYYFNHFINIARSNLDLIKSMGLVRVAARLLEGLREAVHLVVKKSFAQPGGSNPGRAAITMGGSRLEQEEDIVDILAIRIKVFEEVVYLKSKPHSNDAEKDEYYDGVKQLCSKLLKPAAVEQPWNQFFERVGTKISVHSKQVLAPLFEPEPAVHHCSNVIADFYNFERPGIEALLPEGLKDKDIKQRYAKYTLDIIGASLSEPELFATFDLQHIKAHFNT